MPLLVRPGPEHLPQYIAALKRGWSSSTTRDVSAGESAMIEADAQAFLGSMDDPDALAGDIEKPDGTMVKRLPGLKRFIWDGGFCGIVNLRWQEGTAALSPWCLMPGAWGLGHIGYSVVPWKQRRGYATRALAEILPEARKIGLAHVEISTDVGNIPSQKVIIANGGVFVREVTRTGALSNADGLLYRIDLAAR